MIEPRSLAQRPNPMLWIVGGIGLLWNAMGVVNLLMQLNAGMVASMPAEQRAIIESRPAWATLAFAIGVAAGVLGCLLLLLRKAAAFPVLAVSLAAIALHMLSYLGMFNSAVSFGPAQLLLYAIMPLAVAALLMWYAAARNRKFDLAPSSDAS